MMSTFTLDFYWNNSKTSGFRTFTLQTVELWGQQLSFTFFQQQTNDRTFCTVSLFPFVFSLSSLTFFHYPPTLFLSHFLPSLSLSSVCRSLPPSSVQQQPNLKLAVEENKLRPAAFCDAPGWSSGVKPPPGLLPLPLCPLLSRGDADFRSPMWVRPCVISPAPRAPPSWLTSLRVSCSSRPCPWPCTPVRPSAPGSS